MAYPEAPPTYREVIVKDGVTGRWVFDPHWLRWLLNLRLDVSGGGVQGSTGPALFLEGEQGEQGDPGIPGATGAAGAAGAAGADGAAGPAVFMLGECCDDESWAPAAARQLETLEPPNASVNFNGQQGLSFRIENRTSDPSSPTTGQIWLRTDL